MAKKDYITRFAPSPTGPLHLGHAFSALTAWERSKSANGQILLRIEDIDQSRARPQWEDAIFDDLRWLGLAWPEPVMRQSQRQPAYDAALQNLWDQGLLYACQCSRRDIAEALSAPQEGVTTEGPDGLIYPGTCRNLASGADMPNGQTIRLNMDLARQRLSQKSLWFRDTNAMNRVNVEPSQMVQSVGDVVLARRDLGTSYHLSVVVDDAAQKVSEVVRGADLYEATQIHVVLQALLDLPTPNYYHHTLIRDDEGRRLAKRDDAKALSVFRSQGLSRGDVRALVGL